MTLHRFHGGLSLPAEKEHSLRYPITVMPTPQLLYMPIFNSTPMVATGDSVARGQLLAVPAINQGVPVLASAAGSIGDIEVGNRITLVTDATVARAADVRPPATQYDQQLNAGGIVGLGGAAFPTATKLASLDGYQADTLIINAAECEPMISCDQALIRAYADQIVTGIRLLIEQTGVSHCIIGIEDNKPDEIAQLTQALNQQADKRIKLVTIPTLYPTGGERQLILVLTGRKVPYAKLPRDIGILCLNIATALAVKRLLIDQQPLLSRVVTVNGDAIQQPRNVQALFGTPIKDLIEFVEPGFFTSGSTGDNTRDSVDLVIGGPMTGIPILDINTPVSAATNCVLVNHHRQPVSVQPCIRCGLCEQVCPAELLPQQLFWYCRNNNFADAIRFKLDACIECACCDFVCPAHIPLTERFRQSKTAMAEHTRLTTAAEHAKDRFEARSQRLANRERQRRERLQARKLSKDAIQASLARAKAKKRSKDAQ